MLKSRRYPDKSCTLTIMLQLHTMFEAVDLSTEN